jgi:ATP-dependent helicase HrpA
MTDASSTLNIFDRSYDRRLQDVMQADRHRLTTFLKKIRSASKSGQPFDRNWSKFASQLEASEKQLKDRLAETFKIGIDKNLPIYSRREEIQAAIRDHQVVVICGETGSGKSTQLPLFLLEMGRGRRGLIGHTQPRRIAARSVSARVAQELGTPLGKHVGFKVRFSDSTGPLTMVKVMTDGILLAETQGDRYLEQYDTIIVDEAHERSLNIDFLLGYLKQLLPKRPDLRVIITSATIDAERFAEYFSSEGERGVSTPCLNDAQASETETNTDNTSEDESSELLSYSNSLGSSQHKGQGVDTPRSPKTSPIIFVEGRTYPVEVRYRPPKIDEEDRSTDWRQALTDALLELENEGMRDVLVFLPSERDIREAAKNLRGRFLSQRRSGDELEILPLYGRLSQADQERIFQPHQNRRVVLATNVAESSITVPGIDAVIDLGLARISRYSPRAKMQRLPIEPISKASADQRKGRCGRVGPGICIRLYDEADYNSREDYTPPEILRTNLASVILQTMSLNLGPITEFPFLDAPRAANINDGLRTLFELGAVDENDQLTDVGRQLASLPSDPRIGRMILAGDQEHCLHELLIIASVLEIQDPRDRPLDKQQAADEAHAKFAVPGSDFLTLLKLWNAYHEVKRDQSRGKLKKWCEQNFLSVNRMREWGELHQQLQELCEERRLNVRSRNSDADAIHKALLTGLLSSVAYLSGKQEYIGANGIKVHIWPGSVLSPGKIIATKGNTAGQASSATPKDGDQKGKRPAWFMAAEIIETSKQYARTVADIRPEWIEPISKHLAKKLHYDPFWDKRAGLVKCYQNITLFGLPIVTRRTVRYGHIDPEHAREIMIKEGIIKGEIVLEENFLTKNQQLLSQLNLLEAKLRKHDLLRTDDAQWEFYAERIPKDIHDVQALENWWKKVKQSQPEQLTLTAEKMLAAEVPSDVQQQYPDELKIEHLTLPLRYKYEPGEAEDGVTMVVPREALHQIPEQLLDWLVPGLVSEKIAAVLKSLPKQIRVSLIPLPETAKKLSAKMPYGFGPFYSSLSKELSYLIGQNYPADRLVTPDLPGYLKMGVEVVDENKKRLGWSKSLTDLQRQFPPQRETWKGQAKSELKKEDRGATPPARQDDVMTTWAIDKLEDSVKIHRGGIDLLAYPCLEDVGEGVVVKLAETAEIAKSMTRLGLARLFLLAHKKQLDQQIAHWPKLEAMELYGRKFAGFRGIRTQLKQLISRRVCQLAEPLPKNKVQYDLFLKQGREQIPNVVAEFTPVVTKMYEWCLKIDQHDSDTAALHQQALFEMQEQREALFPQDFFLIVPYPRLLHYPRYLQGIALRYEKLIAPQGVQRDRTRQQQVETFWRQYAQTPKPVMPSQAVVSALDDYRWMLEEYRVSVFAQELGTNGPISPQRLEKAWEKVVGLLKR